MSQIHLLPSDVSDLIAAGEVVERPASVVKELVENAIDAGATKIRAEIFGGGIKSIKITDNGCGMSAEDARKAFLKHATSKISAKHDLFNIHTLGFRGEALASISSVAKVQLKTKQSADDTGTAIVIEGGTIVSDSEVGCADGSAFEIKDLFFNTPARLKFLKSESTEIGHITYFIEKLALSHPEISFSYYVNGVQKLFTPGNSDFYETLFSVYGKEFCDSMIPVSYDDGKTGITGFCGKPLASKPNRNFQVFFVNGRVVRSRVLQSALESVYHSNIMVGRYPCCVLMLSVACDSVDINVHPSKLEIKFSDERSIADAIYQAVKSALNKDSAVAEFEFEKVKNSVSKAISQETPAPAVPRTEKKIEKVREYGDWTIIDYKKNAQEPPAFSSDTHKPGRVVSVQRQDTEENNLIADNSRAKRGAAVMGLASPKLPIDFSSPLPDEFKDAHTLKNNKEDAPAEQLQISDKPCIENYRILGEVFDTYIVIELRDDGGNELLFIDKHALHERIRFEKLRQYQIEIQTLLVPQLCKIGSVESGIIMENREELSKIGFDVDDVGGGLVVRAIPALIGVDDVESVLAEYASLKKTNSAAADILDKFLYSLACKSAIKGGNKTSDMEREALVSEYFKRRDELKYCPHGRPVSFSLTEKSIEKQFKRIV